MQNIICPLTFIPVRKEPDHRSEQVTQLIFGESAEVIDENEEWFNIQTHFDNYIGWIEKKVSVLLQEAKKEIDPICGFARLILADGNSMWLSGGSELVPDLIDNKSATIITINPELDNSSISKIALQYLGTPYLWGGRTFMGIDCSGLSQVVYKPAKIALPRDASQQVKLGTSVQFPSDSQEGDLAFFDNEEGLITHVGIILEPGKIIHASGSVRIDKLDHQGIFNVDTGKYTHKLRVIKRLL